MRDAVTATEDEHGTNMITRVDAKQDEKDLLTTELTQALKRIEAMTRQYESTIQDHAKTCLEKDNAAKQYMSQITKLENKLASVSVLKFEASAITGLIAISVHIVPAKSGCWNTACDSV